MKLYSCLALAAASCLSLAPGLSRAAEPPFSFVYETQHEFFGNGDLDADGRNDVVIVDKESGKYRLGYQTAPGTFSWVDCRPSGLKGVAGFNTGKFVARNRVGLAFASPDDNQITIVEASSPKAVGHPITVPFTEGLGPSLLVAANPGGAGNRSVANLYVGSIYNSPDPDMATLLRNDGSEFPVISSATLPGAAVVQGNLLSLKSGQPEMVCLLARGKKTDSFLVQDVSSGKVVTAGELTGLPSGSAYAAGQFGQSPASEFIFYKPGATSLLVRPVEGVSTGKVQFGSGNSFDLGQPVRRVVTLTQPDAQKLLVIFGQGHSAGIFTFDGVQAPSLAQTLTTSNEFTCAANFANGFVTFSQPVGGNFSTRYDIYKLAGGKYAHGSFGSLASLADNDNITLPDIYARIVATQKVFAQSQMKPYTNTIPGTRVSYVMEPIPGGEFAMGSPDDEKGRKPDEGPQHKVKISPFWMGRCEITWNEYELFMYPDEEHRMRRTLPTDAAADKLADAVTHPSKPYVEMSFGMGKDGYPAIAMSLHAACKYCQWLSAKTGQFYRLPTEAEWEYAARAGTTTTYFFGNDPSKLGEYAWYEDNSDFKYQKVGTKKPSPWGLCDIYGNVVEWTLDQYSPDYYKQCAGSALTDPWNQPTKRYPCSVRGGSWNDDASMCRSAARRGSDPAWDMQDPQLPKSQWYFSDAQWIGFRIVRPLKVPTADQMQRYWSCGIDQD
jgi:formylglycine-generating enzyme required for sulfatase activity